MAESTEETKCGICWETIGVKKVHTLVITTIVHHVSFVG